MLAQPNTSALVFNGTSDHVALTTGPADSLVKGYTIEAWAYPTPETTWTAGARRILSNFQSVPSRGFGFGMTHRVISGVNAPRWRLTTFGIKDYDTTAVLVSFNTWSHVAVTLDNSNTATFYVNGQFGQAIPHTADANISTAPLNIGRNPVNTEFFPGVVDEIRLWNYVRTAAEIQADMNRQLGGNEPGLIGYWPLNEGTGTFTDDVSPSNASGTVAGAQWTAGADIYGPTAVHEDWGLFQ